MTQKPSKVNMRTVIQFLAVEMVIMAIVEWCNEFGHGQMLQHQVKV